MASVCPKCDAEIPPDPINIGEGVALCLGCGHLCGLKSLAKRRREKTSNGQAGSPPRGCRVVNDGSETRVIASTRSATQALALTLPAIFWNGIVLVFVLVAVAGYWTYFVGPLPDWVLQRPAQLAGPERDFEPLPLGVLLFMTIFLTPHVIVGQWLVANVLMSLAGRVEVRLGGGHGAVFKGIGPFGRSRRFDPLRVRDVRWELVRGRRGHPSLWRVVIEAEHTLHCGADLTAIRRLWLLRELRSRLLARLDPPTGSPGGN